MATLNASSHSNKDREDNDYYATPPEAVKKLLEKELFIDVRECACWEWHISKVLVENWINVKSTDLIDRWYWEQKDFLLSIDKTDRDIITNPPFKYSTEFTYKSMELLREWWKLAMLLRIQFLESVRRNKMFSKYPPKTIYVFSRNIRCAKNWDFKNASWNASTYCRFVWEKWYTWKPTIDRII